MGFYCFHPKEMVAQENQQVIELPERLLSRVERRLPRTEFDSADEYVAFVLEEVLYQVESETDGDDFESVDEQEVKDRLRSLGYLDE